MVKNEHHARGGQHAGDIGQRSEQGGELELLKGLKSLPAHLGETHAGALPHGDQHNDRCARWTDHPITQPRENQNYQ